MTPTTTSTNNKCDIEDGVIPKEILIISLSPKQNGEEEKGWSEYGPEEPTEVVAKDSGPPEGGYGWIVVAYFPDEVGVDNRAPCVLNAFTWGINSHFPRASSLQYTLVGGSSISVAMISAPFANWISRNYHNKLTMSIGLVLQAYLITKPAKICRSSLLIPTEDAFVKGALLNIGRDSASYWSQAIHTWVLGYLAVLVGGRDESVVTGINKCMHEDIRRRDLTYVKEEEVDSRLAEKALEHRHYYTNPPIATLAALDIRVIPNLIVGQHGFGEIQFERPVDLSGLSSLDELLGKVIQFGRTICQVYPEGYQEPPPGEGLNVPATVRLVKCWPNKNDEEAVEDYVELLRMCPDTEFTGYDLETGTWEFRVSHFSSYTVGGSDYYISNSRRVATSSTPSTSMPSNSASPSPSLTGPSPSSDTYSHVLRSQRSYTNPLQYARPQGNPRLVSLVNQAYEYWKIQKPIPEDIRNKIDAIALTNDEYLAVFCKKETPQARAIELIDGHVRFREYTLPSHGAVLGNVIRQLVRQDPMDIFQDASGVGRVLCFYFTDNEDIPLGPSNKKPDAMFSIVLANLPNGGAGHTFQQLPNGSMLFPVICFEDSISNESLTELAVTDVQRYFLPGTGTRWWLGVKVFKKDPPRVTRWWAGHALRDLQNGTFQNSFTFQPGSMALGLPKNADITVPVPGLRFAAPLVTLLHPLAVPHGYASHIVFDIERLRQIIVQNL